MLCDVVIWCGDHEASTDIGEHNESEISLVAFKSNVVR